MFRLVKGDGEIVEEIVSKERQKAINKVHVIKSTVMGRYIHVMPPFSCSKPL